MRKKMSVRPTKAAEPITCAFGLMAHPLELAACPSNDIGIDPLQGGTQLRLIEVAVVADPATDARVVHRGQLSQGQITAMVKLPASDFPADALQRLRAGSGLKAVREDTLVALPPHRLPSAELKAQKVERNDWKVAPPVRILAVDDLRLLRMQHQLAGGEAIR